MRDPLQRLYETKLAFLATVFVLLGIALLVAVHLASGMPGWTWLTDLPLGELGGTMFTTGLVVVAFEYLDGKDSETRATARLRRILAEQAPAMRDAVIDGFAFDAEDLKRVASPAVLDQVTRNSLAIQLGDRGFAEAVYDDLREQTVRAGERRHDLQVRLSLSHWERGSSAARTPLLAVTARWEYTVVPTSSVRRFVCVSDLAEYRELTQEPGSSTVWHFTPANGINAGSEEAFELLEFSVDGKTRPIRRTGSKDSQTYATSIGKAAVDAGRPVKIAYTYRTLVWLSGNYLHLRIGQPTHGLSVEMDYSASGVRGMSVLDFMASSQKTTVSRTPADVPERALTLEFGGWALPASGVVFVWSADTASIAHSTTKSL